MEKELSINLKTLDSGNTNITITDNETGISTIEPFTAILTFTENGNDSTVTVKPTSPEGIGSDFLNVEFTGKYYSSTTTWTPVIE